MSNIDLQHIQNFNMVIFFYHLTHPCNPIQILVVVRVPLICPVWLGQLVFLLTVPSWCFFCGLFLLVMFHVGVCCAVVSVPCSLVVTWWKRANLLAAVFVVFCHFPNCVLVHIRIKGEIDAVKLV